MLRARVREVGAGGGCGGILVPYFVECLLRTTGVTYGTMLSCYDKFLIHKLKEHQLCFKCSNYLHEPIKTKSQLEMGRKFRCSVPSCLEDSGDDEDSHESVTVPRSVDKSSEASSGDYDEPSDILSPPRKAARAVGQRSHNNQFTTITSPRRVLHRRIRTNQVVLSPRRRQVLHPPLSPHHNTTGHFPLRSSPARSELVTQLNQEREARLRLEAQLQRANHQLQALTDQGANLCQVTPTTVRRSRNTPFDATSKMLTEFVRRKVPMDEVVNGVLSAMISRTRLHGEMNNFIISNEDTFSRASECFRLKMYKELQYKFRGWMCLQQLDLAATVSFRSYDTIRMIEFAEDEKKKYRRGLLSSRHKLTRLCRQLESHGAQLLPYQVTNNSVKFNVPIATQFILDRHGLWGHVLNKDHVQLAATVDGGSLSWNVTQVSAGVKVVDPRAIEPVSAMPLFGNSGYDKVQSKYHCYPLYVVIAKDNKDLYRTHLSQFFDDINMLEVQHAEGLEVAQCHDMCSLHKTLGVGGGMKVALFACYCCNRHRDDLLKPMDTQCSDCIRLGSNFPCFHTPVSDEGIIDRMRVERQDQLNAWPHLNNYPFNGRSRLRCGTNDVNNVVAADQDPLHIEFIPVTRMERDQQRKLFKAELLLRNLLHMMDRPTSEMQICLHEVLLVEKTYLALDYVVKAKSFEEAMIRLEQALPCLLHLENRVSEAIIEHLLCRGLRLREGNASSTSSFISAIEYAMNNEIFGSVGCPSLWKFPLNPNGTVSKIKFANWRARKVIEDIQLIVDLCLSGDEYEVERDNWLQAIYSYQLCIKVCFHIFFPLLHKII